MPIFSSFVTLIELASREAEQASSRLGVAIQAEEDAWRKLALLEYYRDDHTLSGQQGATNDLPICKPQYFQAFSENREGAIVGLPATTRSSHEQTETERKAWQAVRRKRLPCQILDSQAARQHRHAYKS